jgi:predicted Zn-dependent protease with MMP-like domain
MGWVVELTDEEFEACVDAAVASIPLGLRRVASNVSIEVTPHPPPGQDLLGLYHGIPLTDRGDTYAGVLPDRIQIFREPILRIARDRADAEELIRTTVLHEIAHHFGIDDDQLHTLGYG